MPAKKEVKVPERNFKNLSKKIKPYRVSGLLRMLANISNNELILPYYIFIKE